MTSIHLNVFRWMIENNLNEVERKLDDLLSKKDVIHFDTFELKWNFILGEKAALKTLLSDLNEITI